MTMQDSQVEYFAFMGDSCGAECKPTLSDIERSIAECMAMLDNAIYRTDKNEISFGDVCSKQQKCKEGSF